MRRGDLYGLSTVLGLSSLTAIALAQKPPQRTPRDVSILRSPSETQPPNTSPTSASSVVQGDGWATLAQLEQRTEREVCERWLDAQTAQAPIPWAERATDRCERPRIDPRAITDAQRMLDAFRWLSGVGAVGRDAARTSDADACAVMMDRADQLAHHPAPSWPCYSAGGASGAATSNLTLLTAGMDAGSGIEAFVNETVESLGHRRWCLYPQLAPTALGLTARALCMRAQPASAPVASGPEVVAYPNAGFAPISNFRTQRWSVQDGTRSVQGATIIVRDAAGSRPLPIEQRELARGYGGAAVQFSPVGWAPQAGARYRVEVRFARGPSVTYETRPVRCGGARSGPGGESRGFRPAIAQGAIELAPSDPVPLRPGAYASWSTDDEGAVTVVQTTVSPWGSGALVLREERRTLFRSGGSRASMRQWTTGAQPVAGSVISIGR